MMLNTILLQAAGDMMQFVFLGGIVLVMYFLMIRPQQRKQKEAKKFQEGINKGDTIITIGGLHGKVVDSDEHTITLDVDRGTKLTFERSSISLENSKRLQETK